MIDSLSKLTVINLVLFNHRKLSNTYSKFNWYLFRLRDPGAYPPSCRKLFPENAIVAYCCWFLYSSTYYCYSSDCSVCPNFMVVDYWTVGMTGWASLFCCWGGSRFQNPCCSYEGLNPCGCRRGSP